MIFGSKPKRGWRHLWQADYQLVTQWECHWRRPKSSKDGPTQPKSSIGLAFSISSRKFTNKETLVAQSSLAMVTPLNAFLHLLIITWNLWYNHIRPTSKTRPTFFTNSSNLVQSSAIYSLRLMFHHHIQTYHITHYNQCSVFKRFKSLITRNVMLRLYKAFMLPRFHCWSLIWHFCCERIVIN